MLNNKHISDKDYEHALKTWNELEMNNLGENQSLYLKCDVLLLADAFEEFKNMCKDYYRLHPSNYLFIGLSWDALLKITDVKLDLLSDNDMYQFIKKGMRAGVSYINFVTYVHSIVSLIFLITNTSSYEFGV